MSVYMYQNLLSCTLYSMSLNIKQLFLTGGKRNKWNCSKNVFWPKRYITTTYAQYTRVFTQAYFQSLRYV